MYKRWQDLYQKLILILIFNKTSNKNQINLNPIFIYSFLYLSFGPNLVNFEYVKKYDFYKSFF